MNVWQTSKFKLREIEIKFLNHGEWNLIYCKTIIKIRSLGL